jgi:hypothetical protein
METVPKYTIRRYRALQYAAGEGGDIQPTYGVCRPLELAGLIIWVGSYGIGFAREQLTTGRGWRITARGKAVLTLWQKLNHTKVVRHRGPGNGFKIKYRDGSLSPETYAMRAGAQNMINGTFGSVGGIS